ncbi:hypothetical protein FB45DRAFT_911894 [Roridomyces roridus]|uniref:Uncharacterized protein n=1 Tax=Roridomyces roridus TaxID=1738132 RepID=A0AAD7FM08_9AGAR|nr:hypothetical protein FB45DRAFT_911894 [Roridomyces roridus]
MTTMLETYDAHMDIDMHHQPAEPWFDAEAQMDDDVLLEDHDHDSSNSVEVDMEDGFGETEYEMADGEGEENYEEMSADLLDIEVYDASETLEDAAVPPEHGDPSEPPHYDMESPETVKPAPTPAMSPVPRPDRELPETDRELESEHPEVVEEHGGDGDVDEQPTSDPPLELVTPLPDDEVVAEEAQNTEEVSHAEAPQAEEPVTEEPVTSATDPHEISEGVYIDPPPAVLLSFQSSDHEDVCLFNQPPRSRSPSPSGDDRGHQVYTLLLHLRPILYYEPLANVFEALRQEDHLARMPHLADSELVLNAHDLQLVISEDNVYAREVTLHDLNVLHDASAVAGPLRLRLSSIVPRFIVRYHLLQDKVSRLHIATGNEESHPDESVHHKPQDQEQSDPAQDEEPHNDQAPEEPAENADSGSHEEESSDPAPEDQVQDEQKAAETETVAKTEDPHEEAEESGDADEYTESAEGDGEDGGEGSGEPAQPDEFDDGEADGLADDEEKAEHEPIVPLSAADAEDPGNDLEKPSTPQLASSDLHDEPAPSITGGHEDVAVDDGAIADNTLDTSEDAPYDDEESYEEEVLEGDAEGDTTWEAEEQETASNQSSVTLSSKASKRSFDEVEYADDEVDGESPPGSPGAKRTRIS